MAEIVKEISQPFDAHVHLREGPMLETVARFTADVFARGVVMGNLLRPVVTAQDVAKYREATLRVVPNFEPIMTVMLVKQMTPPILTAANQAGAKVLKLIPGGTSTNSELGIKLEHLKDYYPVLEAARDLGMIFSGHWELDYDNEREEEIFPSEREVKAMPFLEKIIDDFPDLKIVVEHVSDRRMVNLVKQAPPNVVATVTVHHLLYTYFDVYTDLGKIKNPHLFCKPIMKECLDRIAISQVVINGNKKFFFGSDSAPHPLALKLKGLPVAGVFSAPTALPQLTQFFEQYHILDRLENFVSEFGPNFYGLPVNKNKIKITKEKWFCPSQIGKIPVVPLGAGQEFDWQVEK